jgi:small subunit ribosomal protein S13
MARIAGVDLPRNKRIDIALTYVHGIGKTTAKKTLSDLDISPETKSDRVYRRDCCKNS